MKQLLAVFFVCLPLCLFGQAKDNLVGFIIVDSKGKQVEEFDPNNKSGYKWSYIDLVKYSPEVAKLHNTGKQYAQKGNLEDAIKSMEKALQLQKNAPTILYDLGYTYLMANDSINALRCYKELDLLSPNGYFENKLYIAILEDEIAGRLPKGFCLLFTKLEDSPPSDQKIGYLEELLKNTDNYPPLVKEYVKTINDDVANSDLIKDVLKRQIDPETRGFLTFRLTAIYLKTDIDQAINYWRMILNDYNSPTQWKALAQFFLKGYDE